MNNIKEAMKLLEQVMTGPGIEPSRRDMVSSAHALLREFVETTSDGHLARVANLAKGIRHAPRKS